MSANIMLKSVPNAMTVLRLAAAPLVAALMAQIEDGETEPRRVKIDGPLVVRGSARRPAEWKANWKECDDERL